MLLGIVSRTIAMIQLPNRDTDAGLEARVLLAECRGPAFSSFNLADATQCMQLMDRVLWNRVANPVPFGAKAGSGLPGVVKARGQFAGFANYPNYDASIKARIQDAINIANNSKDSRSSDYAGFVNSAINVANSPTISDPSAGKLVAWRTAGASSPGSGFSKHATVAGVDFYFQ
jgi:hypothetical protein